jgi:hypothetical protein
MDEMIPWSLTRDEGVVNERRLFLFIYILLIFIGNVCRQMKTTGCNADLVWKLKRPTEMWAFLLVVIGGLEPSTYGL